MGKSPKNKEYQKTRNWLTLTGLILSVAILVSTLALGLTSTFYDWASGMSTSRYAVLLLYFLFFSVYSMLICFPLSYYSGFLLEHKYELSNQKLGAWVTDYAKKQVLSFALMMILVVMLYTLIWKFEAKWWILAWAGYAAFSLVLGKLFPILIIPMFYKYSPIDDGELRARLQGLANQFGFAIQNVFSLNLSKTTKKANAMFTGFGKSRRVVLADTLLSQFTHDEIESVVGHELGHCKHRDIWQQFAFGVALSFVGFWLVFQSLGEGATQLGFTGAEDVRAFPLLCLILFFFQLVILPLSNGFSRHAERRADRFALDATGNQASFVSAMEKLSETNLADPDPHPLIEFFLYDHPAIAKRIKMAKEYVKPQ